MRLNSENVCDSCILQHNLCQYSLAVNDLLFFDCGGIHLSSCHGRTELISVKWSVTPNWTDHSRAGKACRVTIRADIAQRRATIAQLVERRAAIAQLVQRRAAIAQLVQRRAAIAQLVERRAAIAQLVEHRAAIAQLVECWATTVSYTHLTLPTRSLV